MELRFPSTSLSSPVGRSERRIRRAFAMRKVEVVVMVVVDAGWKEEEEEEGRMEEGGRGVLASRPRGRRHRFAR